MLQVMRLIWLALGLFLSLLVFGTMAGKGVSPQAIGVGLGIFAVFAFFAWKADSPARRLGRPDKPTEDEVATAKWAETMSMVIVDDPEHGPLPAFEGWDAERYREFLGGLLWSELKTPQDCDPVFDRLEEVEAGLVRTGEWRGAQWRLEMDRAECKVVFMGEPETHATFPTAPFKAALAAWSDFNATPPEEREDVTLDLGEPAPAEDEAGYAGDEAA